ncbi:STAS domain-containing protein [Streptomyces sp. NPDC046316]|uniref:STAS domain-containing protein n=1 Tax=Streptomyces sp. NPDC046316 TaxID=3154494 RepID=UPI0033D6430B
MTPAKTGVFVTVRGEIDLDTATATATATATDLRTALLYAMTACDSPGADVSLDLSQVSFCDSTGLNTLLRARLRALNEQQTSASWTPAPP